MSDYLIFAVVECAECHAVTPIYQDAAKKNRRRRECGRCSTPKSKVCGNTKWFNPPMKQQVFDQYFAYLDPRNAEFNAELTKLLDDVERELIPAWKQLMATFCTEYLAGQQPDPNLLREASGAARELADQLEQLNAI